MVEKRIIDNINRSIPSSNNYKSIESKLDFKSLQIESKPKHFKKRLVLTPIIASAVALVLISALIPTFIHLSRSDKNVSNPMPNQLPQIYLLKTSYTSQLGSDLQTERLNGNQVIKLNTYDEFAKHIYYLPYATLVDFEGEVDESLFENYCLFQIKFYCDDTELNLNYDGKGVCVDDISIVENTLVVNFSVPCIGRTEDIQFRIFYAAALKSAIDDNFSYIYDVIHRDTGEKGSYYYHY